MIYSAVVDLPGGLPHYAVHQFLYSYFPQHPHGASRPFVFRQNGTRCLLVSGIKPACPYISSAVESGRVYAIEGLLVPTNRRRTKTGAIHEIPITANGPRRAWFAALCERHGGKVGFCQWYDRPLTQFRHSDGHLITLQPGQVKAMVMVIDAAAFEAMLLRGLGRGKAFGHGLLYVPELMDATQRVTYAAA